MMLSPCIKDSSVGDNRSYATKTINRHRQVLYVVSLMTFIVTSASGAAASEAACPEKMSPTMEEMMYYADITMLGRVVHHYDNDDNPADYTAEMEVICAFSYPATHLPSMINVSNAGNVSGTCMSVDLPIDHRKLVYLSRENGNRYVPRYEPSPEGYKDEIHIICNVTVTYPEGVSEGCEDPTMSDDYGTDDDNYYAYNDCVDPFQPDVKQTNTGSDDKVGVENSKNGHMSVNVVTYSPGRVGHSEDDTGDPSLASSLAPIHYFLIGVLLATHMCFVHLWFVVE